MKYFLIIVFSILSLTSNSQKIVEFNVSDCDGNPGIPLNRIIDGITKIQNLHDTLEITFSLKANCSEFENPIFSAEIINDTLQLRTNLQPEDSVIIEGKDTFVYIGGFISRYAECDCHNILTFKLIDVKMKYVNFPIKLNNKYYPKTENQFIETIEKFTINNQDFSKYGIYIGDTINRIDIYGRKQGRHILYDKYKNIIWSDYTYKNNKTIEIRNYNEKGDLKDTTKWISKDNKTIMVVE